MSWRNFFIWRRLFKKRRRYSLRTFSIVPVICDYPEPEKKAQEILQWLVSIKAVQPELSDCTLYMTEPGYAIGEKAGRLVKHPRRMPYNYSINGMEIITRRTVFETEDNRLKEVLCPACRQDLIHDSDKIINAFLSGYSRASCPECKKEMDVNEFFFRPAWGFSNLGFVFWNWEEFKPGFVKEFEKRLGCKVKVVLRVIGAETPHPP